MMAEPTPDTKAVLMLTAPLLAKTRSSRASVKPLTPKEYSTLAMWLRDGGTRPAELMERDSDQLITDFTTQGGLGRGKENPQRLRKLLERGVELALAVERWGQRAIWVLGRDDPAYPDRWKQRLDADAFPLLYGCGDPTLLERGGLAVVGSRRASSEALRCAEDAGRLAARADCTIVSGGARGSDQAAMRGALSEGGTTVGVLANGLGRAVVHADHREELMEERLVLVCPWDPGVGFQVWRAMERNKLVYALADAALVAAYEPGKGGTWRGATEQLALPRPTPVYVRRGEPPQLLRKGARPWPEPASPAELTELLRRSQALPNASVKGDKATGKPSTPVQTDDDRQPPSPTPRPAPDSETREVAERTPAEELWATVRRVVGRVSREARTPAGLREALDVTPPQAGDWWTRFVRESVLEALGREASAKSESELAEAAGLPADKRELVRARLRALVKEGLLQKKGSRPVRYCLSGSLALANASVEDDEATGTPATPVQTDGDRQQLAPAPAPAPDSETQEVDSAMGGAGNGPLFSQADAIGST